MTRIPETLRRRLERSAAGSGRSMNTEIIHRLEESYEKNERYAAELKEQMENNAKVVLKGLLSTLAKISSAPKGPQQLADLAHLASAIQAGGGLFDEEAEEENQP